VLHSVTFLDKLKHSKSSVTLKYDLKKMREQSKERATACISSNNYRAAGMFTNNTIILCEISDDSAGRAKALVGLSRIHVESGKWKLARETVQEANMTQVTNEGLFVVLQILVTDDKNDKSSDQIKASFFDLVKNNASLDNVLAAVDLIASNGWSTLSQQLFTSLMQESRFYKSMNIIRLRYLRFLLNSESGRENCVVLCQTMLEDSRSGHIQLLPEQARTAFSCIVTTSHESIKAENFPAALEWLKRALEMLGDHASPEDRAKIDRFMSYCYQRMGHYEQAFSTTKEGLKREESASGLYHLGSICLSLIQGSKPDDAQVYQQQILDCFSRLAKMPAQDSLHVLLDLAERSTNEYLNQPSACVLSIAIDSLKRVLTFEVGSASVAKAEGFQCRALRRLLQLAAASTQLEQTSLLNKVSSMWTQTGMGFCGDSAEEYEKTLLAVESFGRHVALDLTVEPNLEQRKKLSQVAYVAFMFCHTVSSSNNQVEAKYAILAIASLFECPSSREIILPCIKLCREMRSQIKSRAVAEKELEQIRTLFLLETRASMICSVNPSHAMLKEISSSAESLITSSFYEEISDILKDSDIELKSFRIECLNQSLSLALTEKPKPNFETIAKLIRKVFEVDPDSAIDTFRRVEPYAKDNYPEHERQHLCYQALTRARLNGMLMNYQNMGKWYKTTLFLLDSCPSYSSSVDAIREEASKQLESCAVH